jgi:hypothetical protein
LKYPIGLATSPEMNLLNHNNVRKTDKWYWFASPYCFYYSNASGRGVYSRGDINFGGVNVGYGVRPVVSIVSGTRYSDGDGSVVNPYVVE